MSSPSRNTASSLGLQVPAGKQVQAGRENLDPTAEEFETTTRWKRSSPAEAKRIGLSDRSSRGPMNRRRFHQKTAKGRIVAK